MSTVLRLPDPALLALVDIEVDDVMMLVTATAITTEAEAKCPLCQQASSSVHSSYIRTLADLPCSGQRVRWFVQVRRFFCKNPACKRKIFTERLPSFAPAYARRTLKQAETLGEMAFVTGGRPGERLTPFLGMNVSHDTLIRLMRRTPQPSSPTPRLLGVDDFAFRRGQRWGTILVDLESHTVIDLLPDREGETFLAWLQAHPGIEVVSRDRASAYAEAARQGAPEATQVADRFHLLVNLRDAVQRLLQRKHSCLPKEANEEQTDSAETEKQVLSESVGNAEAESIQPATQSTSVTDPALVTFVRDTQREKQYHQSYQEQKQACLDHRQARFEEARELYQQGVSIHAISRTTGMCRQAIRKYINAEQNTLSPPPSYKRGPSKLDPFLPYILNRWAEGCFNSAVLFREIREQGYTGSESLLRILVADMRKTLPPGLAPRQRKERVVDVRERPLSGKLHIKLLPGYRCLSPSQAAWLLVSPPEELTETQCAELKQICQACIEFQKAYELAQSYREIMKERKVEQFPSWLESAEHSGIKEFKGFVQGLQRDEAAVKAALSTEISNGQTEGQVHRLKMIKRLGYGRANFDLLRLRVLHGSGR